MRNIKLKISYHGKYFSGWQVQKDVVTIQDEIEKSLKKILKEDIKLTGSGRTDAGVHAIEQIANFKTKNDKMPVLAFIKALNSILKHGIKIMGAEEVDLDFNSRKSAKQKTYLYQIHNDRIISALEADFYFSPKYKLDIEKMKEASKHFIGEHDFIAFAAAKNSTKTTTRTIFSIDWKVDGDKVFFEITGNGFLMKMVRNIMGTLIEIGHNRKDVDSIPDIIKSKNRNLAGATAAAKGLFLKEVVYA